MERQATMVKDMTTGKVVPLLLRFAFPLFVSNALQAVYNVVDMVVVGNYIGKAGMSAVSIGGDLLHLLTFVAMGFCSAGQVIIARAVGERRPEDIQKTIGTMFTFLLSVSAAIAVVCYLLRAFLLTWLNTPAAARAYAMDYLVTCVCGLVFIYGYNIVSAILRGMGDSKRPFLFIAVAAILNMVLDVLFVFRIDGPAFRRLLALGIPMAIQAAAVNLSKIVLMSWINLFDVTYSALAGIFNKLNTMCGVISQSFTTAGSTMVGQNLGARKYRRVNQTLLTILLIGLGFATLFTIVMLLWPAGVYGMFTPDADVLGVAAVLTLPVILNFFGAGTRCVAFSLINGSGKAKLNLAVAIIDGMISRIGLAALFGFALHWDCFGFWMGDALAGFMPLLIGGAFYLFGSWKTKE